LNILICFCFFLILPFSKFHSFCVFVCLCLVLRQIL
jgi:hypothetical protein